MIRPGAAAQDPAPLREIMIIGGGCYGTFYARQLLAARVKSALQFDRLVLVDRDAACQATRDLEASPAWSLAVQDWAGFLAAFLDRAAPAPGDPDDAIVPSPLMPHLFAEWLLAEARRAWPGRAASLETPDSSFGTPYDAVGPDGVRYVSFADWICPTHCVEPLTCPVIRAPRTWEMGDAFREYASRLERGRATAGPALFTTRHHAYGVGMIHAAEVRASRALLARAGGVGPAVDLVVGTVSACHGAASLLRLGPLAGSPIFPSS